MIDNQSNLPFSVKNSLFSYDSVQQSLYAPILDVINNEIDIMVNLMAEGNKLSEVIDDEAHIKEAAAIVNHLNLQIYQHIRKMNALRSGIRKTK